MGSWECLSRDEGEEQMECFRHPSAALSAFLIAVCWNPTDDCRAHPEAVMHYEFMKHQKSSVLWLAAEPLRTRMEYLVILAKRGHHQEHCRSKPERGKAQGTSVDGRQLPLEIRIAPKIPKISLPLCACTETSLPFPISFKIHWL